MSPTRGITAALTLLAVLAPMAQPRAEAPLSGFDAETVQRYGEAHSTTLSADHRRRLNATVKTAIDFRTWMAGDPEGLLGALTEGERAILAELIAPGDARDIARWRYFFRGSVATLGHALSEQPRVGFYNPIVDGWVMADFARSAEGMRLTALSVVAGDRIASAPPRSGDPRPPWVRRSDLPLPSSLAIATAANIAAFERLYPPLSMAPITVAAAAPEPALIERRLGLMGVTIGTFVADPAYNAIAEQILATIEAGDGTALAQLTGRSTGHVAPLQRIAQLSAPARRTFELRGSFRRPDGMTIAFGSPYSGKWLIFADLDTSASDRPRLTQVVAVDLGQLD